MPTGVVYYLCGVRVAAAACGSMRVARLIAGRNSNCGKAHGPRGPSSSVVRLSDSLSVRWTEGAGVFAKPVILHEHEECSSTDESRAATTRARDAEIRVHRQRHRSQFRESITSSMPSSECGALRGARARPSGSELGSEHTLRHMIRHIQVKTFVIMFSLS